MPQNNVDINLLAKQDGRTKTTLNELIKKLEKINKLSTFQLGLKPKDIEKIETSLKNIASAEKEIQQQEEDVNKKLLQREGLLKKLELAQRSNWRNAVTLIKEYLKENEEIGSIDALRMKQLDTLIEKEKTRVKWAKTGKSVKEDAIKVQEKENEALKKRNAIIKQEAKKTSQKIYGQGLDLDATKQRAMEKGYDKVIARVKVLYEQLNKGIPITQNQLKYLGLIEKAEERRTKTLTEEVAIRHKLSKIAEQNAIKEKKNAENIQKAEFEAYQIEKSFIEGWMDVSNREKFLEEFKRKLI